VYVKLIRFGVRGLLVRWHVRCEGWEAGVEDGGWGGGRRPRHELHGVTRTCPHRLGCVQRLEISEPWQVWEEHADFAWLGWK
jgi:hypothetical protein